MRERLESYVIADDVVIEDVTARWAGLCVGGRGAAGWLADRFGAGAAPGPGEFARAADGGLIFQGRRGEAPSWECLLPMDAGAGVSFPGGLVERTAVEMERARIAAGVAAVPADIGPGDLPGEGGLDAAAVSYTKGCYLGQEVMARLKSMGTLRRRLARVAGGGAAPATPCALLQGGTRVGELRSAAGDGAEGFIGLALVTTTRLDAGSPLEPEPGGAANIRLIDTP